MDALAAARTKIVAAFYGSNKDRARAEHEWRIVRGKACNVDVYFSAVELAQLLASAPRQMAASEYLLRWAKLAAADFSSTPDPEVRFIKEGAGFGGYFVRTTWTPERKPWGAVVVPDGIPCEGDL